MIGLNPDNKLLASFCSPSIQNIGTEEALISIHRSSVKLGLNVLGIQYQEDNFAFYSRRFVSQIMNYISQKNYFI